MLDKRIVLDVLLHFTSTCRSLDNLSTEGYNTVFVYDITYSFIKVIFVDISLWEQCLDNLREQITAPKFNTWIRPLQAEFKPNHLILLAPNQFVVSYINDNFLDKIITAYKPYRATPLRPE